jgi:hypothetical protein
MSIRYPSLSLGERNPGACSSMTVSPLSLLASSFPRKFWVSFPFPHIILYVLYQWQKNIRLHPRCPR